MDIYISESGECFVLHVLVSLYAQSRIYYYTHGPFYINYASMTMRISFIHIVQPQI